MLRNIAEMYPHLTYFLIWKLILSSLYNTNENRRIVYGLLKKKMCRDFETVQLHCMAARWHYLYTQKACG
jgi:hypothetical protein